MEPVSKYSYVINIWKFHLQERIGLLGFNYTKMLMKDDMCIIDYINNIPKIITTVVMLQENEEDFNTRKTVFNITNTNNLFFCFTFLLISGNLK